MIQATPFDLTLLTAATNEPIQDRETHYAQVYRQFDQFRALFLHTNRRLAQNPALAGRGLRVPLTETLLWQLLETPPWSEASQSSNLYTLKAEVVSFLYRSDFILDLDDTEIEEAHSYQLLNAPNFLPNSLASELCESWVQAAGACGFERGIAEPWICLEPIYAVWVVSGRQQPGIQELRIKRTPSADAVDEECVLPLLTQTDQWTWERQVRESLWQDARLPFNGPHPDGPFGYRPLPDWQPGHRPRSARVNRVSGYKDALGGIWQWGGGRAQTATNPFGGHWDVQLVSSEAKRNWRRWLQDVYQRQIRWRKEYVNVEPDGRITDRTFDFV